MKILFVLENYFPHVGGVETLFKYLAEGIVKRGHDVTVVTHRLKGTKKSEIINGVKVRRVSCFHSRYWFSFLSIPKVIRLAKNVDVIHTTMFTGAFPAWVASRIRKKPCVLTVPEVWIGLWDKLITAPENVIVIPKKITALDRKYLLEEFRQKLEEK